VAGLGRAIQVRRAQTGAAFVDARNKSGHGLEG